MRSVKQFILPLAILLLVAVALSGCSGAHVGFNYGIGIHSGPYGPTISPSFNIGISGGSGGWYGW